MKIGPALTGTTAAETDEKHTGDAGGLSADPREEESAVWATTKVVKQSEHRSNFLALPCIMPKNMISNEMDAKC